MSDRAVIYTRVSTEDQAKNGTSLAAQRKACLEYCEREEYEVSRVFVEEGESAKTADRTQLKELLKYCREQRNIKVVIVYKLDRFARKVQDHQQISALLAGMGVRLRSVTEPIDDSSVGKLMEAVLSGFAQFDNDVRTERTVKGMKERLQEGRWTFPPPLGYRASRDAAGAKTIIPDEVLAPLIAQAFEEFATGLYKREEVLRKITDLGLRTRKGKHLSPQSFSQMLRKPVYSGRIVIPKWELVVAGRFQALISREVFDKVQAILDGRAVCITPRAKCHTDFPLRGFVRCGCCSEALTGSWSKGRNRYYAYYHCQEGCTRANKDRIENEFQEFIAQLQPNPGYVRLYREIVTDVWQKRQGESKNAQSTISLKVEQLQENKRKLEEAFIYQHAIDRSTYNEMRTKLVEDLTIAGMELRDAQGDDIEIAVVLDFAETVLLNASNLWRVAAAEQKQRLQRVLFPEGATYSEGKYRTAVTSLLFSGSEGNDSKKEGLVALTGIEPVF